jgi:adenylate kinase family enzyme
MRKYDFIDIYKLLFNGYIEEAEIERYTQQGICTSEEEYEIQADKIRRKANIFAVKNTWKVYHNQTLNPIVSYSNCCNSTIKENTDICNSCGEHCVPEC